MSGFDDHRKSKANVEDVLAEFEGKKAMLAEFCTRTKGLIEASLQDANIQYQSVQVRVKTSKKLRKKYSDPAKDYQQLDDITDLAGLRVVTYYEDDVDKVAQVIKQEFDIDWKNSVDKGASEPDRFGYNALNFVCWHLKKRTSDVEYKKFVGVRCEIQITSILRHGWSEIEHEWYDLQDAYPDEIKRRFSRIIALLEIAESEFRDIRKSRTQYERSVDVQVEANILDLQVDALSMKSFIEREPLVQEIDESIAAALGTTVADDIPDPLAEVGSITARLVGLTKLQHVRDSLAKYQRAIPEYALRCRREIWSQVPAPSQLAKGLSVYILGLILVNVSGEHMTREYLNLNNVKPNWDIARQVALGREIAAKY